MSDSTRRMIRTVVALVLGIAAGLPLLVQTAGVPSALPGLGTVLAVAASVTRVMALPAVNGRLFSWLQMAPPKASLPDPTAPAPLVPPAGSGQ
ncbi:hypothetical protein ACPC54_18005 [Kitasatospora sp. NPDC094028]